MRITGNDDEGQAELGNFIDPESKYPVIVTTSRLLSTGVDAQTCRLIVIDREVGSMTEFKQIVGRGTRVHEDTKKYDFTLMDFRKATNQFADPDFDGSSNSALRARGRRAGVTAQSGTVYLSMDKKSTPPYSWDDETIIVDPVYPDSTLFLLAATAERASITFKASLLPSGVGPSLSRKGY